MTQSQKPPRRILIVEDNRAIAGLMKEFFVGEGFDASIAADGGLAIQSLHEAPPDVIVLDMMMPGVNGWHFLDYKRSVERFAAIPVIVVSAFGEIAKSVHPEAYLPKPFRLESLLEKVQTLSA